MLLVEFADHFSEFLLVELTALSRPTPTLKTNPHLAFSDTRSEVKLPHDENTFRMRAHSRPARKMYAKVSMTSHIPRIS